MQSHPQLYETSSQWRKWAGSGEGEQRTQVTMEAGKQTAVRPGSHTTQSELTGKGQFSMNWGVGGDCSPSLLAHSLEEGSCQSWCARVDWGSNGKTVSNFSLVETLDSDYTLCSPYPQEVSVTGKEWDEMFEVPAPLSHSEARLPIYNQIQTHKTDKLESQDLNSLRLSMAGC